MEFTTKATLTAEFGMIEAIKFVRAEFDLGLRDAKYLVEVIRDNDRASFDAFMDVTAYSVVHACEVVGSAITALKLHAAHTAYQETHATVDKVILTISQPARP
jgi:hypothetical protein